MVSSLQSLGEGEQLRALRREYFAFNGSGSEYFRIWIVNILLTILTVGFYSPWAKVRRLRYIYGSTTLGEGRFDYHASPWVILRGRIIAVLALLLVVVAEFFAPSFYFILSATLFVSIPWLIVRSRMFNMRYTSYRNIRLAFNPAYAESYKIIFLYGLLTIMTLGLALPYAHYRRSRFIISNTRFGTLPFSFSEVAGPFFWAYGIAILIGFMLVGSIGFVVGRFFSLSEDTAVFVPIGLFLAFAYAAVSFLFTAFVLKLTTNATTIGSSIAGQKGSELICDWGVFRMACISFTNLIAIVCTFGLFIPWAQMRVLRFQLNRTWLETVEPLDQIVAGEAAEVSALGDEIGQVFDVDLGL